MPVNTNLHKYKNSCDGSKDRLDTKILSQFSKLPDKKSFPEILSSGEYKKMLVSQNSRLSFRVSKLDLFEARLLFQFSLVTQRSF